MGVKTMGPGNFELNDMMKAIEDGMTFVTGYWYAADMNWMDGEACGSGPEHCNMNPAYISNWRLTSNGGAVPAPSPVPTPPSPDPAPAPPSPDPVPAPAPPQPTPAGNGKCCWGPQCTDCQSASNWCSQSLENCWQCNGGYCAA